MIKSKCIVLLIFLLSISCKRNKGSGGTDNLEAKEEILKVEYNKVKTKKVLYKDFNLGLKTRGKVFAQKKVGLKFKLDEKISKIYVSNGKKVSNSQIIALQENTTYKNKVIKAKEQLERAKIDVEDILIGFNYALRDSSNIPKPILEMAKNRSNYNTAISNLNEANIEFASTILKSPINGIVANLETKTHSYPDNTEPFCIIIDNSVLEVEFSIIEDDYVFLSKGQPIEISTLLDEEVFKGVITEINPMVDENGMIKAKGVIKDVPSYIIDGMNVNIIIKKVIPNKLYVPKESVVLRDNKKVVFTYKEGKAIWNYVETSLENYEFVVVEKGLKKDDEVIYSGNVNLAHYSNVVKQNE
ncbi:efflux RND transporter periplasmic adaptor subunit [Aquimarina gracilis]|uniref:Efflux RND transporter periplasmic adaptor subunit n=1 Tax=Aquimarina gracilis TaxID=874422 RepID=A0ABU5ZQA7_9FLAO|nr:efflux RND transporter periplasmic adaptor subunit [Aquimarina gracilis]MEB3344264.1 efflux RND transporter periplasmic adaptor subunit [Aquimarina gracilis]